MNGDSQKGRRPYATSAGPPYPPFPLFSRRRQLLWLKAFHVIAMVTWFAGLFYLPRLFVYPTDTHDSIGAERFRIMEGPLFASMSIGAAATLGSGITMLMLPPAYLAMGW